MEEMQEVKHTPKNRRNQIIGGGALVLFGLVALVAQFVEMEWIGLLILPVLSLIFLIWGILTRQSGFFIPAGILGGIGLGTILLVAVPEWSGDAEGGVFMLAFALGWVAIPVLSIIFTRDKHLWALIPAGIMALIGAGLLFGGFAFTVLEAIGKFWPVILIIIGFALLLQRGQKDKEKEPENIYEG
jgi:CDP-diglyceride synthetase